MGRSLLNNEDKDFVSRRPRISSDSCLVSQIVVQCHVEVNNVRIDANVGHENVALFQQTKANIKTRRCYCYHHVRTGFLTKDPLVEVFFATENHHHQRNVVLCVVENNKPPASRTH